MKRLFVLLVALLAAAEASAQSGSIGGFVSAGGRPARGVSVLAQASTLQRPRETSTGRAGRYWLPAMPPGTYDVTFALAGHQTVTLRAEVREGEQTRLDCALEVTEDEEAVTRTGGVRSVGERPQLAWTLDREVAETLPLDRFAAGEISIAPEASLPLLTRIGPVMVRSPLALHRDALRSTSVIFGAPAADTPEVTRVFAVPQNGAEELLLVRSTIARQDGATTALHEVSISAPLTESIWTFLSASGSPDRKAALANVELSPTKRDTIGVTLVASDMRGAEPFGAMWTHTDRRFTAIGTAGNTLASFSAYGLVLGHELAAGIEHVDERVFANSARTAGFVRDRWALTPRIALEAGVRAMAGSIEPRAGAVVNVWRDWKVAAAWSRVLEPFSDVTGDEVMLSVARPIASAGYARAAFVSSDAPGRADAVRLDAQGRYLFFAYGASVGLDVDSNADAEGASHAAAWFQAELPTIGYHISFAALERWKPGAFDTDLGFRYALERENFTPFVGLDVVNILERDQQRLYRLSVGFRR